MSAIDYLKVMIVDDTSSSRMILRDGLDAIGIKNIVHAADGEQALKMIMTSPVHLVVSDYNMPKINGLQLLQAIRAYKPTSKTPFIMLTGRADKAVLEAGTKLGLNNYLTKPFNLPDLKKAIETVVGRLN